MLKSYLVAMIAISGMMVGWAVVQQLWTRVFDPRSPEADALARRISCGKCGCATPCSTSESSDDGRGHVSINESGANVRE